MTERHKERDEIVEFSWCEIRQWEYHGLNSLSKDREKNRGDERMFINQK